MSRSTSYPSLTLEDALARLTAMKEAIGVNGKFNRETILTAIGYASLSGASARAVASLVHYGLLVREKDLYALSELGQQYLMPLREGEDKKAIELAAIKPKLFKRVYEDYQGQVLPKQLHNILTIKYSIQTKVAPLVVKTIESSFKFAGILGENGILALPDQTTEKTTALAANDTNSVTDSNPGVIGQPVFVSEPLNGSTNNVSQQGVSHSGQGWTVTVVFKKSRQLTPDIRKKVRALMYAAEDLSDDLYLYETDGEN